MIITIYFDFFLKNQGKSLPKAVSLPIVRFWIVIQKSPSFSEPEFTMMHNDVLLLQNILWKKIKGDGGEQGRKILNQLARIPK